MYHKNVEIQSTLEKSSKITKEAQNILFALNSGNINTNALRSFLNSILIETTTARPSTIQDTSFMNHLNKLRSK